jgi:hypothetical protein
MPPFSYYGLWLLNVALVSCAIALFEIVLEKDHGWASGLAQSGLARPLWQGSSLARLLEKPYVTVYHLLLFGAVVPLILAGQCWIIRALWITRAAGVRDAGILTVWRMGSVRFVPLLSGIAAWLAIFALEDFLWFALNWHYPSSMYDLLSGRIWWHTRWITLGRIKLPRFYLPTLLLACIFLYGSVRPAANASARRSSRTTRPSALMSAFINKGDDRWEARVTRCS